MYRLRQWYWGMADRTEEVNLDGKTIIITGANTGIGKAAVDELVSRNKKITIILACRNISAAKEAIKEIQQKYPGSSTKLIPIHLDLSDLSSVKSFVTEFGKTHKKLDILINNGGTHLHKSNERQVTKQGFELHFGVNHLGHFLLSKLLVPHLEKGAPSRVVTVSSSAIDLVPCLDFDDLNWEKRPMPYSLNPVNPYYSSSKLANFLFTQEFGKRYKSRGINSYTLCPGYVNTDMFPTLSPRIVGFIQPLLNLVLETPEEGCQTILHCALSKKVSDETGLFYRRCINYLPSVHNIPNPTDSERLWLESEKLVEKYS